MTMTKSPLALMLGAILLLSGTAGDSRIAAAQTVVKFGTSGGLNTVKVPLLYTHESGIFKKNGLDVRFTDLVDDTTAVQSLISGEFDLLYTGAGSGMAAIAKGADIKMVNAFAPWTDYQFVARSDVRTLKDMEGKVLGVSKVGAVSYLAPIYALQKEGVDTKKVQVMSVGNDAARGRALAAGTIQGAVINGLDATKTLQADPSLRVIYDVGAIFGQSAMSNAVFARGDLIKNKPQVVQAAVTALIEGARALQSNKSLAVAQALKSGLPADAVPATYDRLFAASVPYHGVDGGIDRAIVDSTIKVLKDSGGIDKDSKMTAADVLDMRFNDQALKELGPYKK